jgi:hypothetical protein
MEQTEPLTQAVVAVVVGTAETLLEMVVQV